MWKCTVVVIKCFWQQQPSDTIYMRHFIAIKMYINICIWWREKCGNDESEAPSGVVSEHLGQVSYCIILFYSIFCATLLCKSPESTLYFLYLFLFMCTARGHTHHHHHHQCHIHTYWKPLLFHSMQYVHRIQPALFLMDCMDLGLQEARKPHTTKAYRRTIKGQHNSRKVEFTIPYVPH